tara:strand:+ start:581 stop:841 length:261 start_codon:yes stop_codon:yes gene_type:complete
MTTVAELIPGDVIDGPLGILSATFVSAAPHPIYEGLQLVTWRMSDGEWSHDALRPEQYVGEARPSDAETRESALRRALLESEGPGA